MIFNFKFRKIWIFCFLAIVSQNIFAVRGRDKLKQAYGHCYGNIDGFTEWTNSINTLIRHHSNLNGFFSASLICSIIIESLPFDCKIEKIAELVRAEFKVRIKDMNKVNITKSVLKEHLYEVYCLLLSECS